MCHQVVDLVQGALEGRGMVTASITMLPEITLKIRPPRALAVPYPLGFPLGEANQPELQRRILRELLGLTGRSDVPFIVKSELRAQYVLENIFSYEKSISTHKSSLDILLDDTLST